MTYGIGGAMAYEEEEEMVERAQTQRERVTAAYDLLYPTAALTKGTKYWEGYAAGLRDMVEQLT